MHSENPQSEDDHKQNRRVFFRLGSFGLGPSERKALWNASESVTGFRDDRG